MERKPAGKQGRKWGGVKGGRKWVWLAVQALATGVAGEEARVEVARGVVMTKAGGGVGGHRGEVGLAEMGSPKTGVSGLGD